MYTKHVMVSLNIYKQGKSEGFESCDRPIVRKRPIWVKICDVLYRVTLKFDGWPWETIGHLSFAVSSFVQHFIAIGELKLELQSGNAQFGSNSTIFRAVWLEIWCMTLKNNRAPLLCYFKLYASFHSHQWIQAGMMTSSNGNIFRVTGHLCGEFSGPLWIPRTKARDAELWCFLWSAPE